MVRMCAVLCTDKRYRERKRAIFDGIGVDRPSTQSRMPDVVALRAGKPFQQVLKPRNGCVGCHGHHNGVALQSGRAQPETPQTRVPR